MRKKTQNSKEVDFGEEILKSYIQGITQTFVKLCIENNLCVYSHNFATFFVSILFFCFFILNLKYL